MSNIKFVLAPVPKVSLTLNNKSKVITFDINPVAFTSVSTLFRNLPISSDITSEINQLHYLKNSSDIECFMGMESTSMPLLDADHNEKLGSMLLKELRAKRNM